MLANAVMKKQCDSPRNGIGERWKLYINYTYINVRVSKKTFAAK